jgi:phosphomannomutase
MPLIKSISGIRGTIGGKPGDNLTAPDIVAFSAAFGQWLKRDNIKPRVVIGRDSRISGSMVSNLVCQALISTGLDVIDLDLSTTPTVEVMVPFLKADAGIIITASHNPRQWNALKFVNKDGEFISADEGAQILRMANNNAVEYASVNHLGSYSRNKDGFKYHIGQILNLELVEVEAIKKCKFRIVVDCINCTGAIAIPPLLDALGCSYTLINDEMTGDFAHNPEPLPEHLSDICKLVKDNNADVGIVVDPDVDRLAFISEDGSFFGEEYTLVTIANYVLSKTPGNTVSNLSSTRALEDITSRYNKEYFAAAVGEVNVVKKMKEVNAVIGGEGNGGVIYPPLHYGRDALVGIALMLSQMAQTGKSMTQLKDELPEYVISKKKVNLEKGIDVDKVLSKVQNKFSNVQKDLTDGVKLLFDNEWVHMRKSNTEPIIRIYAESTTIAKSEELARKVINHIHHIVRNDQ